MQKSKVAVRRSLTNGCKKINEKQRRKEKNLSAEFQRITRRDKKAVLSDQCKEIGENNRMGKIRYLFKIIRYTKGTIHAKMDNKKQKWYGPNRNRRY